MLRDNPAMDKHPIQGDWKYSYSLVAIETEDKFRPDVPHGSYADVTFQPFALLYCRLRSPKFYRRFVVVILLLMY